MTRLRWTFAALSLAACLIGGCSDDKAAPAAQGGTGGTGTEENPFFPKSLDQATKVLQAELGEQLNAGDIKISVVANRHSNYWTPAQIGTGRASSSIGCFADFDATSDGKVTSQAAILERKVSDGFAGIAVSAIDSVALEPAVQHAVDNDLHVLTFDSDTAAGSVRSLYLGTINYEAGVAAGEKMVELLGDTGGAVAAFAGLSTAANAQERIQGIKDAFEGTRVDLVESYFDEIDFAVAQANVESAFETYPDLKGLIGVYAYNGPIALGVREELGKIGTTKLVAFDLDPATLAGLEEGTVDAAIGQRPYWMGNLSVYILFAMKQLGAERTKTTLAPWISGDNQDIFSTGQDVVTPDTLPAYKAYLSSLGISSG
jgi:ribose transport system substrate-binding protein